MSTTQHLPYSHNNYNITSLHSGTLSLWQNAGRRFTFCIPKWRC